jgi:4-carboxymuconolactone decarboxylase
MLSRYFIASLGRRRCRIARRNNRKDDRDVIAKISLDQDRPRRIEPLSAEQCEPDIARMIAATMVGPVHPTGFLGTFAHNPGLLRRWAPFGSRLIYQSELPDRDRELVILRTAWNTMCGYEWTSHGLVVREMGMTDAELARIAEGPDAAGLSQADAALLRAVDELHASSRVSDDVWAVLAARYSTAQQIELVILVGNYTMIAYFLNSAGVGSSGAGDDESAE